MNRPRLLDLFCGGGGCSVGYARAGFDVVGVDIVRQHAYPFAFVQADALAYPLDGFDAVHASPPCKPFTALRHRDTPRLHLFDPHPDMLAPTLERFAALSIPWIIENVPGAPLPDAVVYCGSSFGLRVRRHRLFASNLTIAAPPCDHDAQGQPVGVYGNGGAWDRTNNPGGGGIKVAGADAADALGVDWTDYQPTLSQMIPPAFTEHIGAQIIGAIRG